MSNKVPWYENDVLWEKVERHIFSKWRLESATAEMDQLLELAGIAPGAAVLDLCCGVGRHSLELARRGFEVTAVDRTKLYLKRARHAD